MGAQAPRKAGFEPLQRGAGAGIVPAQHQQLQIGQRLQQPLGRFGHAQAQAAAEQQHQRALQVDLQAQPGFGLAGRVAKTGHQRYAGGQQPWRFAVGDTRRGDRCVRHAVQVGARAQPEIVHAEIGRHPQRRDLQTLARLDEGKQRRRVHLGRDHHVGLECAQPCAQPPRHAQPAPADQDRRQPAADVGENGAGQVRVPGQHGAQQSKQPTVESRDHAVGGSRVGRLRRQLLHHGGQRTRQRNLVIDQVAPGALVELVELLIAFGMLLHQPEIGLAQRVGDVHIHQRPEIEQFHRGVRCRLAQRDHQGLRSAPVARTQGGGQQQHARCSALAFRHRRAPPATGRWRAPCARRRAVRGARNATSAARTRWCRHGPEHGGSKTAACARRRRPVPAPATR